MEPLHPAREPASGGGKAPYERRYRSFPAGRASLAQLRIYLYTNDEQLTPLVRLLAASVRPVDWHWEAPSPTAGCRLPAYSQQLRTRCLREHERGE